MFKNKKKYDIYLASGWFNENQAKKEEMIYNKLKSQGLKVFSPKRDVEFNKIEENQNIKLQQKDAHKIFKEDLKALNNCKKVIAIVDEFDSGTMWELGYSYAKGIKCEYVYINSNKDTFNNLMITESSTYLNNNLKKVGKWKGIFN